MSNLYRKTAADIGLYLYVGIGYIREVIIETVDAYGETYNEFLVDQIQDEIIQHSDTLEELLIAEWADTAVVEFDGGYEIHGTIDYEGVETELDSNEIVGIENIVDDFVIPFVDDAIDTAGVEDIIWIPVESSNVKEFAYDIENRFLYVRFLPSGRGDFAEGSMYVYYDVEPEIYQGFLTAPSKGKYVWSHLRDRYDYQRME